MFCSYYGKQEKCDVYDFVLCDLEWNSGIRFLLNCMFTVDKKIKKEYSLKINKKKNYIITQNITKDKGYF